MFTIKPAADVRKKYASISKRAKTLRADMHEGVWQALAHAAKHGDIQLCRDFLLCVGQSQRQATLCAFIQHFSGDQITAKVSTVRGKGQTAKVEIVKGWTAAKFKLDEAAKTDPFEWAGDEKPPVVTASDFFGVLFSRMAKLESIESGEIEWAGTPEQLALVKSVYAEAVANTKLDAEGMAKLREADKVRKSRAAEPKADDEAEVAH